MRDAGNSKSEDQKDNHTHTRSTKPKRKEGGCSKQSQSHPLKENLIAGEEAELCNKGRAHAKVQEYDRQDAAGCSNEGKQAGDNSAAREPANSLLVTIFCFKITSHVLTVNPVVTTGASMSDITIGRLSDATGVKIETIRYYEKVGIMPKPPRTSGGQRAYGVAHRARLSFIKRSRDLGFSLYAIRSLLGLADEPPTCGEVHAITSQHLTDVRSRIRDLKRLETTLSAIAGECKGGDTPDCPIIYALAAS